MKQIEGDERDLGPDHGKMKDGAERNGTDIEAEAKIEQKTEVAIQGVGVHIDIVGRSLRNKMLVDFRRKRDTRISVYF